MMAAVSAGAVVEGADATVLDAIADPSVGLAIWHRRLSPALAGALAAPVADVRVLAPVDRLARALQARDQGPFPVRPLPASLLQDIVALARRFARLANDELVDVRLELVSRDACWKFHRDQVTFRMIVSYTGPGTQWVAPADAPAALAAQRGYEGPLHAVPVGAVAIFRGAAGPGGGVVHRSPPIAGTGTRRLLLCIDRQTAASPPPWRPPPRS